MVHCFDIAAAAAPLGRIALPMLRQRTLKSLVSATGVGLHTGQKVRMSLRPAQPDTGVVFRRLDLAAPVDIPARADLVGETRLCSCLVSGATKIYTIEHLMSALSGFQSELLSGTGRFPRPS